MSNQIHNSHPDEACANCRFARPPLNPEDCTGSTFPVIECRNQHPPVDFESGNGNARYDGWWCGSYEPAVIGTCAGCRWYRYGASGDQYCVNSNEQHTDFEPHPEWTCKDWRKRNPKDEGETNV